MKPDIRLVLLIFVALAFVFSVAQPVTETSEVGPVAVSGSFVKEKSYTVRIGNAEQQCATPQVRKVASAL